MTKPARKVPIQKQAAEKPTEIPEKLSVQERFARSAQAAIEECRQSSHAENLAEARRNSGYVAAMATPEPHPRKSPRAKRTPS